MMDVVRVAALKGNESGNARNGIENIFSSRGWDNSPGMAFGPLMANMQEQRNESCIVKVKYW